MQAIDFKNIGYIKDKIPFDLFQKLKVESETAQYNNKQLISELSSIGVPDHFYVKDSYPELSNYVLSLVPLYEQHYEYIKNIKILDSNVPFATTVPWFNYQRKNEFIPAHHHTGVLSYVIWLNIPYDINEEIKKGDFTSCFEFTYINALGKTTGRLLQVSKDWEGTIIMFPSGLQHMVYPFYTSDETRISISGNIVLKANNDL